MYKKCTQIIIIKKILLHHILLAKKKFYPEYTFTKDMRKWKPRFSRICQKVEDWLQLFSRQTLKVNFCCTFHELKLDIQLASLWIWDSAHLFNLNHFPPPQALIEAIYWVSNQKRIDILQYSFLCLFRRWIRVEAVHRVSRRKWDRV